MPKEDSMHEHRLEDGTVISHTHEHAHSHAHTKQVLRRLSYAIGHMHGISNMVEEGRDCSEVLVQLSVVDASLKKLKVIILKDHIEHCITDAVRQGDQEALRKLNDAFDKMLD